MNKFWSESIKTVFGADVSLVFPRFFPSKKNQVTLLNLKSSDRELHVIAKYFVWGDPIKEFKILTEAFQRGCKVPKPIALENNILFMEFIQGESLFSIINKKNPIPVEKIALWLADFHKAFQTKENTMTRRDGMPPNYIIHQYSGEIYGLDFEEAERGDPLLDLAQMSATLILWDTSPQKERKTSAMPFLNAYKRYRGIEINTEDLMPLIKEDLARRIQYSPHNKEKLSTLIKSID